MNEQLKQPILSADEKNIAMQALGFVSVGEVKLSKNPLTRWKTKRQARLVRRDMFQNYDEVQPYTVKGPEAEVISASLERLLEARKSVLVDKDPAPHESLERNLQTEELIAKVRPFATQYHRR